MNNKSLSVSLIAIEIFFCHPQVNAQDYDTIWQHSKEDFKAMANSAQQRYESFRQKANAVYEEKLRAPWPEFGGCPPQPIPYEKTVPPPSPQQEDNPTPVPDPVVVSPQPLSPAPSPSPIEPIILVPQPVQTICFSFEFYGAEIKIEVPQDMPIFDKSAENEGVADLWNKFCDTKYDPILSQLIDIRKKHKLSDWLYISVVKKAANEVYPLDEMAGNLLANYILAQSGFDVRPARDNAGKIHLIVHTDCNMYSHGCWEIDGKRYYLIDNSSVVELFIPDISFENSRAAKMAMETPPELGTREADTRIFKSSYGSEMSISLNVNKDYVEMLGTYPVIFDGNDSRSRWVYYAKTRLDDKTQQSLYSQISSYIKGKSKVDAVTMILNWVQTAFVYGYDDEIWGEDRPFHSEETLFYPFCDCEDRAILFSRLVRDLLGLDVVLVHYPGHLATAVHFPDQNVNGASFIIEGKKYIVCDPTFVDGAPIGAQGAELDIDNTVIVCL